MTVHTEACLTCLNEQDRLVAKIDRLVAKIAELEGESRELHAALVRRDGEVVRLDGRARELEDGVRRIVWHYRMSARVETHRLLDELDELAPPSPSASEQGTSSRRPEGGGEP